MRIFIIRHGDPDYAHDSLTEKGWREAELLSERLKNEHIDKIYCSPLGRAQDTARPTLQKTGMTYEVLDWLCEFRTSAKVPYSDKNICAWNVRPQYWTHEELCYDNTRWREHEMYADGSCVREYEKVTKGWNDLLAENGYRRNGQIYEFDENTNQNATIALFCHLGLGLTLLSQLSRMSLPMVWHTFFLPTSSVTTIVTEKHVWGLNNAICRVLQVGDTSHLFAGGEPISWSGLHSPIRD